jgi:hypothetical protein
MHQAMGIAQAMLARQSMCVEHNNAANAETYVHIGLNRHMAITT